MFPFHQMFLSLSPPPCFSKNLWKHFLKCIYFFKKKILADQGVLSLHYCHFGPGSSLRWAVQYITAYFTASLTPAHWLPIAPPSPAVRVK